MNVKIKQHQKPIMVVRAKFVVQMGSKVAADDGNGARVKLLPVTSGSAENAEFYRLTPGGEITLSTINQTALDQFEEGKEYYVDFTKAE
jgi:hypothetical protein